VANLTYWDPRKMIVNDDGTILISGSTYNSEQFLYEIFTARINSSGAVDWVHFIAEPNQYLSFSGMDADADNIYLAYWYVEYDNLGNSTSHLATSKLDAASGSEVWENELLLENQYAATIAMVHDVHDPSGVYQTGYTSNAQINGYDILTFKVDPSGNSVWQNTYSTGNNFSYSQGNDIAINGNGDVVIAGFTDSHTLIALGYSADGVQQFATTKTFSNTGYIYNIQIDDNANSQTYIACEVDNFTPKIYLAQFDDSGNKVWDQYPSKSYFTSMKANPSGNGVTVLGSVYDTQKNNYFPRVFGIDQSGASTFTRQLNPYKGYGAVADFSTIDGSAYYFTGTVKQNNFYTDQMTSRWDVQPLRLVTSTENAATISIYPNPCADMTTIHFVSEANDVFVYDVNGRLETSFKNVSGNLKIATDNWASGVYFVKILNAEVQQTVKLVKE
jgi:hypothetical protein